MKKLKSSIFKQNLLIVSLIAILYTLILIISTSAILYSNTNEIIKINAHKEIEKTVKDLDNEIKSSLSTLNFIAKSNSIYQYIRNENTSYHYFLPILNEITSNLTYYNQNELLMGFTKINDGLAVTNDGYFTLDDLSLHMSISPSILKNTITEIDIGDTTILNNEEDKSIIIRGYSLNQIKYIGLIMIDLHTILHQNTVSAVKLNNHFIGNIPKNIISAYKKQTNPEDQQIHVLDLGSIRTYSLNSTIFEDLSIIISQEVSVFNRIMENYSKELIGGFSILILTSIAIAVYSSNRFYSPIKNLSNFIGDHNSPDIYSDTTNELDFIKSRFTELKLNTTKLNQIEEETYYFRRLEFFSQLLHDKNLSTEMLQTKLNDLSLNSFSKDLFITFYQIDYFMENNWTSREIMQIVSKVLTSAFKNQTNLDAIVVPIEEKLYLLISTIKDNNEIPILTNQTPNDVFNKLTPISSRSIEAIELLRQIYLEEYETIHNKLFEEQHGNLYFKFDDEKLLHQSIELNDRELAESIIFNLLNTHLKRKKPTNSILLNEFKYILLNTITRILDSEGYDFEYFANKHKASFKLINSNDTNLLYDGFSGIFYELFNTIFNTIEVTTDTTTLNIIKYIDENALSDLTLNQVAENFNLSEQHISRLLKQNSNIRFKSYITKIKLEKAKELLIEPDCRVNEVAEKIGYSNVNSFIRVFKKEIGVTPKEYSKLYGKTI
ncbi:hypothetical protein HMPREF2811_01125 [Globicatella sp. HMSC072A10]|uniref:helix-turn-helix transcriptional regulator n=1 Tax=Globicatella sp. HMSC072A10 TaxID=1739315 RepID=UPI0008C92E14|nr:AraC family transcriptional regulator [Globicatella sp. HMSC072A10]OFK58142.1 hypothetical protein HMPREF2811_01125 [Globicatella sp. HMSC072A10]